MTEQAKPPTRPSFKPGGRTKAPPGYISLADRELIHADRARVRHQTKAPEMTAFIAKARAFRKQWGVYTCDGWRFDGLADTYLSENDEDVIRELMARTLRRAVDRTAKAKAGVYLPAGDSDMSDAEVAAGLRWLHVSGVDVYHHSMADYCHAMLEIDQVAAIIVARGFIGKYAKTLRKAGVIS